MNKLLIVLLLASITLNVGSLTGYKPLHDALYGEPCRLASAERANPAQADGQADLVRIAELLGINTSKKTASDLAADICYKLNRNADLPQALDDSAFNKMAEAISTADEKTMREYQRFISSLQGKRVIVIEREK